MDKITRVPKGTAFVCYKSPDSASACLDSYDDAIRANGGFHQFSLQTNTSSAQPLPSKTTTSKSLQSSKASSTSSGSHVSILQPELPTTSPLTSIFTLHSKILQVSMALNKSELVVLEKTRAKQQSLQDPRNTYLLREGVIFPDSPAASLLPSKEVERRVEGYNLRKTQVSKNPNLFVSKTRLSIRNCPLTLTDSKLRFASRTGVLEFWNQVNLKTRSGLDKIVLQEDFPQLKTDLEVSSFTRETPGSIKILQCKLILQKDRLDSRTEEGRSMGFGFVEFKFHSDALACLRWMNNNPRAFEDSSKDENLKPFINESESESQKSSKGKIVKEKDGKMPGKESSSSRGKRPIVEFAVENKLVLRKRDEIRSQQLLKNKKAKLALEIPPTTTSSSPPSSLSISSQKRKVSGDSTSIKSVPFPESKRSKAVKVPNREHPGSVKAREKGATLPKTSTLIPSTSSSIMVTPLSPSPASSDRFQLEKEKRKAKKLRQRESKKVAKNEKLYGKKKEVDSTQSLKGVGGILSPPSTPQPHTSLSSGKKFTSSSLPLQKPKIKKGLSKSAIRDQKEEFEFQGLVSMYKKNFQAGETDLSLAQKKSKWTELINSTTS